MRLRKICTAVSFFTFLKLKFIKYQKNNICNITEKINSKNNKKTLTIKYNSAILYLKIKIVFL